MPIYEYRCEHCQHKLEAIQKISDAPLVDCPACGQPGLKKLISAAGFRLKGGGWYETDFKSGNKKGWPTAPAVAVSRAQVPAAVPAKPPHRRVPLRPNSIDLDRLLSLSQEKSSSCVAITVAI